MWLGVQKSTMWVHKNCLLFSTLLCHNLKICLYELNQINTPNVELNGQSSEVYRKYM